MRLGCQRRQGEGAHLAMWRLPRNLKCWRHSLKERKTQNDQRWRSPPFLLFTKHWKNKGKLTPRCWRSRRSPGGWHGASRTPAHLGKANMDDLNLQKTFRQHEKTHLWGTFRSFRTLGYGFHDVQEAHEKAASLCLIQLVTARTVAYERLRSCKLTTNESNVTLPIYCSPAALHDS